MWVGIATILTTLGRRVWIDRGFYTLYPNEYIILVAGSATCRKSVALGIGMRLLNSLDDPPDVFAQKITPEALIRHLKSEKSQGTSLISASELSVFLGAESYRNGLIALLTAAYDSPDELPYETISRGLEQISNVCISLLGATTVEWLRQSIPTDAIGGGFTSRIIFVYQKSSDRISSRPKMTVSLLELRRKLIEDLNEIRCLEGEYTFHPEAGAWFDDWYVKHMKKAMSERSSRVGYEGRKHDHLLKISMAIAAASRSSLVLLPSDLEIARDALEQMEMDQDTVTRDLMTRELGLDVQRVLDIIAKYKTIQHSHLLKRVCHFCDAVHLAQIIQTLREAELISTEYLGRTTVYSLED